MIEKGNFQAFLAASSITESQDEESIVVGTSSGELYQLVPQGINFQSELKYKTQDNSGISGLSFDPKSRVLALGLTSGVVAGIELAKGGWEATLMAESLNETPLISLRCLQRGENLFVAAFANGMVRIMKPDLQKLLEVSCHSRQINALSVSANASLFATCGDDTFVNIWEVSGQGDKLRVSHFLGSRINDMMIVGVSFGGAAARSIVAVPYDYAQMLVWENCV
jgi:WD40 repeat protein